MKAVFADTSFYAAIVNVRDELHERAKSWGARITGSIVTTEFVLLETANFCTYGRQRAVLLRLIENLRNDAAAQIVPATASGFQRGLDLFGARSDKEWSLTDCISFVIMEELALTDALTADEHFEQGGFRALLRAEPPT